MTARLLPSGDVHAVPLTGDDAPAELRVRWTCDSPADGFQVYVNGELAAVTDDPADRQISVVTDGAELLAVAVIAADTTELDEDQSHLLQPQQRGRRARLTWPRLNAAPLGAMVNIFGNGGAGAIDFVMPLNREPIEWFDATGKWGFGLGGFGRDDFGRGGSRAVGFGAGAFGRGEFGFDVKLASWLSEALDAGEHRFAAVGCDDLGNASPAPAAEASLTLHEIPARVAELSAEADPAGAIRLTWQLEPVD